MPSPGPKRSLAAGDGPPPKKTVQPDAKVARTREVSEDPAPGPSSGNPTAKRPTYITDLNLSRTGAAVRCRVTAKSELRSWGPEGQSKRMFTFAMADKSGEISGAAFGPPAEVFHKRLQVGKCYQVSLYQTKAPRHAGTSSKCEIHLTKVAEFFQWVSFSLSTLFY